MAQIKLAPAENTGLYFTAVYSGGVNISTKSQGNPLSSCCDAAVAAENGNLMKLFDGMSEAGFNRQHPRTRL